MTLVKAISYLEGLEKGLSEEMISTYGVALQLGIEALKRVKLEHERDGVKVKWLLPGETGE